MGSLLFIQSKIKVERFSMNAPSKPEPKYELLRHTLATLAYRARKTVIGAPENFASFDGDSGLQGLGLRGLGLRTPGQILAHMGDLLQWALSIAKGQQAWEQSKPLPWEKEVERFFAALKEFDDFLASGAPVKASPANLFQGPVADALTHVGQIAMLRRMAGAPMKGENYYKAEITVGRVGLEQAKPKLEF
jgi:hypothetical protein